MQHIDPQTLMKSATAIAFNPNDPNHVAGEILRQAVASKLPLSAVQIETTAGRAFGEPTSNLSFTFELDPTLVHQITYQQGANAIPDYLTSLLKSLPSLEKNYGFGSQDQSQTAKKTSAVKAELEALMKQQLEAKNPAFTQEKIDSILKWPDLNRADDHSYLHLVNSSGLQVSQDERDVVNVSINLGGDAKEHETNPVSDAEALIAQHAETLKTRILTKIEVFCAAHTPSPLTKDELAELKANTKILVADSEDRWGSSVFLHLGYANPDAHENDAPDRMVKASPLAKLPVKLLEEQISDVILHSPELGSLYPSIVNYKTLKADLTKMFEGTDVKLEEFFAGSEIFRTNENINSAVYKRSDREGFQLQQDVSNPGRFAFSFHIGKDDPISVKHVLDDVFALGEQMKIELPQPAPATGHKREAQPDTQVSEPNREGVIESMLKAMGI